jgi:hypothetical protein
MGNGAEVQGKLERFVGILGIEGPVLALYDTDDLAPYEPVVRPGKGECCWAFYNSWREGKTLAVGKDAFGCPGGGRYLVGVEMPGRDLPKFLYEEEGLKASLDVARDWVKNMVLHEGGRKYALIGPFRVDRLSEMATVTFLADPDQLAALVTGAVWHRSEAAPGNVLATLSAGCGLLDPFAGAKEPMAVIGSMDMAMRQHLPRDIIAFTVNIPMFHQLLDMGKESFLYKPFWKRLREARTKTEG